jgi:hypothetical protein
MRFRCLLFTLFLASASAYGQLSTGTIAGTVTDASGAVIPGAEVRVTNPGTGLVRTLNTESAGLYRVPNLPPGGYKVEVSFKGFQPQSKVSLVLSVDQSLTVDFQMNPGELKESVTVMARAEQLVQRSTSSLGQVIEEAPLRDLPLNGRNFQQLILLKHGLSVRSPRAIYVGSLPHQRWTWHWQPLFG